MAGSENDKILNVSELVDRYWRRIYKLCLFYLRNVQDAEDATQAVFEKALKKQGQFQGAADPYTWIYRIAVNTALNILSRRRIIRWLSLEGAGIDQGPADAEGPAQRLERLDEDREKQKRIVAGVGRMSRREKTAFYLFYYEKLPQKTIAGILGTSVASVESLVHKAVKKIRHA